MNIVVLVKQVPDSGAERNLRPADNTVDRGVGEQRDQRDGRVRHRGGAEDPGGARRRGHHPDRWVRTRAAESIRKALSMGPDKAVHVLDDALHGSCAVATSKVLAAALRQLEADLVICGAESTDGRVQVMPHMLAERLGVAALTGARKLTVDGATLTVERQTEEGYEVVTAPTPAIVSVWDTINEPRYPSFKGIMAAKKKPVQTLSLADLGVAADEVGFAGATSAVRRARQAPAAGGRRKVTDEGEGGVQAGRVPRLREVRLRGGSDEETHG